jgi:hypothetical protein
MRLPLIALLTLLSIHVRVVAQETRPSSPAPSFELRVYLMTMSPGDIIYERFGHNLIVIHDPNPPASLVQDQRAFETRYGSYPATGPLNKTDVAYHYGAFSFEQENFVWRFIQGRMQYWMAMDFASHTADEYARQGRGILLQELNLTAAQKIELERFLIRNAQPENREYRYDYYRDNCSTRVRDAIDRATGGQLKPQLRAIATGTTFRSHTRRLTSELNLADLFWFTSFTYILGHQTDEPLSAWEESFLPGKLAEHLRNATVTDESGVPRRLVLNEYSLSSSQRAPVLETEPHRFVGYLVFGICFGAALVALARVATLRKSRWPRALLLVVLVPWAILWGAGGAIGVYAWLFTDHTAGYRDENLFQMSPLLLVFAFMLPSALFRKRRGLRLVTWLAVATAGLSLLGLLLKILPAFWQHNAEIIALALPANLGLAAAFLLLWRRTSTRTAPCEEKQSVSRSSR